MISLFSIHFVLHKKNPDTNVNKIDKSQFYVEKIKHKNIDFSYKSSYYNYISLTLSTYALYQVENASLALRAFEIFLLRNHLTPMSKEKMQKALQNTFWEGRMEEVGKDVFFDGAHNEDGIRAFLKTVSSIPCDGKRILCFSAVDDKDYEQMITLLCESGLFSKAVVIDMETTRGLSIEQLQCYFSRFSLTDIYYERGAEDGINRCLRMKKDNDQVYNDEISYRNERMRAQERMATEKMKSQERITTATIRAARDVAKAYYGRQTNYVYIW